MAKCSLYKNVPIIIEGKVFLGDLIDFDLSMFDVIFENELANHLWSEH